MRRKSKGEGIIRGKVGCKHMKKYLKKMLINVVTEKGQSERNRRQKDKKEKERKAKEKQKQFDQEDKNKQRNKNLESQGN